MKPERVCEISLQFQPPNTITTHFHSFKPITIFSFYFPSFSLPPRLIIFFLFKKLIGTNIRDWIENYVQGKKKPPMIRIRLLKRRRKEVKVDPKLGGQWNVKEKHIFTFFHFPPTNLFQPSIYFSLTLRFYFTMVLSLYSRLSFLFFDL
jgi:hypothetical protein